MHAPLDTPVRFLKGVGESRASALTEAGVSTLRDLLYTFPIRYEDRRTPTRIIDLGHSIGQPVLIRGRIVSAAARITPVKRLPLFEAVLDDGTSAVRLIWFHQPYLEQRIRRGDQLSVYGVPRIDGFGPLMMESPEWERLEEGEAGEGAIVAVYPRIGAIPQKTIRRIIADALTACGPLADPLPTTLQQRLGVVAFDEAIRSLHFPEQLSEAFLAQRSRAHERVILQEFLTFQLAMQLRRSADETRSKSRKILIDERLRAQVRKALPFRLTAAQKRVLREIAADLQAERPMYRLLQGDVGSGKTIVALIAALIAIYNGHQVALLAPTEILVEQHEQRIRQLVDESVRIARASGSMKSAERKALHAGLRDGSIQFVVGTHAVLEEKVVFRSLGLAIVDEQHRFGVEQRQRLFAKGDVPDVLVMTATPIPRSLALALYGDLDLSVIDELPPGRQRITTAVRATEDIDRVFEFIMEQVRGGAQVYVVHPIIDESEGSTLSPLTRGFQQIRERFPALRVEMLHGRMKPADKEETMTRFKERQIDLLVSTTVIEVGIDVPNASIMLIVDADRFGLSQLHQLRGRVGRGTRKSYCILLRDESCSGEAKERLAAFARSKDGFEVAEHDLRMRGPGEFLGKRQSGALRFRMGHILRDHDLMERAREEAIRIVARDPRLAASLASVSGGTAIGSPAGRD